ncbi:MAG TPA: hypothetical protein VN844_05105 [Pyrinomonadaceae bacterium]|nr:hypothetical protein [Pyrinomonadaceae bacterium]
MFRTFGNCIQFSPLPKEELASLAGFQGVSSPNLSTLSGLTDYLGNISAPDQKPTKLLGLIGNAARLSFGVIYLNKNEPSNRCILPGQLIFVLSTLACRVLGNPDNLPKTSVSLEVVKQNYFLPKLDGRFGAIAKEMSQSLSSFSKSFPKPLFYESEAGALILATYESQITRRDRSGRPIEGRGRSTVLTVPPGERKDQVLGFISEHSNFWESEAVRHELIVLMKDNRATGGAESQEFSFIWEGSN